MIESLKVPKTKAWTQALYEELCTRVVSPDYINAKGSLELGFNFAEEYEFNLNKVIPLLRDNGRTWFHIDLDSPLLRYTFAKYDLLLDSGCAVYKYRQKAMVNVSVYLGDGIFLNVMEATVLHWAIECCKKSVEAGGTNVLVTSELSRCPRLDLIDRLNFDDDGLRLQFAFSRTQGLVLNRDTMARYLEILNNIFVKNSIA